MRIIFCGDSLTEGECGGAFIPMIEKQLPGHELINFGKGGDTVISLKERIIQNAPDGSYDIAFLWVGLNDVYARSHRAFKMKLKILSQPWTSDNKEFAEHYSQVLEHLTLKASRIITLPPTLLSENPSNPANMELENVSKVIQDVAAGFPKAEFYDLRRLFLNALDANEGSQRLLSNYLPSTLNMTVSALVLRRTEDALAKGKSKGLYLTRDGIHLNQRGARMVADAFVGLIESK